MKVLLFFLLTCLNILGYGQVTNKKHVNAFIDFNKEKDVLNYLPKIKDIDSAVKYGNCWLIVSVKSIVKEKAALEDFILAPCSKTMKRTKFKATINKKFLHLNLQGGCKVYSGTSSKTKLVYEMKEEDGKLVSQATLEELEHQKNDKWIKIKFLVGGKPFEGWVLWNEWTVCPLPYTMCNGKE